MKNEPCLWCAWFPYNANLRLKVQVQTGWNQSPLHSTSFVCIPGCISTQGLPSVSDKLPVNVCLGVDVVISTFSLRFPPAPLCSCLPLHLPSVSLFRVLFLLLISSFSWSLNSSHPNLANMISIALPCSSCALPWCSHQAHCLSYRSCRPSIVFFSPCPFSQRPNFTFPQLCLTSSSWKSSHSCTSAFTCSWVSSLAPSWSSTSSILSTNTACRTPHYQLFDIHHIHGGFCQQTCHMQLSILTMQLSDLGSILLRDQCHHCHLTHSVEWHTFPNCWVLQLNNQPNALDPPTTQLNPWRLVSVYPQQVTHVLFTKMDGRVWMQAQ